MLSLMNGADGWKWHQATWC